MQFSLAAILLLACTAAAIPASKNGKAKQGAAAAAAAAAANNGNANQNAASAAAAAAAKLNQNATAGVNAAANNGATGISAADKTLAAQLLIDNGDANAIQSGTAFTDAVDSIVKGGDQNEIAVLLGAGVIDQNNQPVEAAAK